MNCKREFRWSLCALTLTALIGLLAVGACYSPLLRTKVATPGAAGWPYYLPRTVVKVTVDVTKRVEDNKPPEYDLSLEVTAERVADPTHELIIEHNRNILRTDDLKLEFTPTGFLQSITAETKDESLNVVGKIIEGAKEAIKAFAVLAPLAMTPEGIAAEEELLKQLEARLDPLVGTHALYYPLPDLMPGEGTLSVASGNNPFSPDWELDVSIRPLTDTASPNPSDYAYEENGRYVRGLPPGKVHKGVLVRGVDPFVVRASLSSRWSIGLADLTTNPVPLRSGDPQRDLTSVAAARRFVLEDDNLMYRVDATVHDLIQVPDYAPVFTVRLDRAAFVTSTYTANFQGGSLTGFNVNQPSSVVELAKVPVDILKAIIAIPSELVQLKIDTSSQEADLLNQQQATREARAAQLDAEATYQEAYAQAVAAKRAYDVDPTNDLLRVYIQAATLANKSAVLAGRPIPFPPDQFPEYK